MPPLVNSDDKVWAIAAHLSPYLVSFFGPLVVWLVKKDQSPFVAQHALDALNYNILVLIMAIGIGVFGLFTCGIGWVLLVPLFLGDLVLTVIATIAAGQGQPYRYPLNISLIK